MKHVPDASQTSVSASSVDPWHAASDFDPQAGDQTGLDLFYTSGITNHLPALIPIAMLYGTPEDAAAEIACAKKRGYPISYVEMGEEPDGQKMLPEDYGVLYLQFAAALHKIDPALKLGGPIFEGVNEDIQLLPDSQGRVSWLGRFIEYLKKHDRLNVPLINKREERSHAVFEPPSKQRNPATQCFADCWRNGSRGRCRESSSAPGYPI